MDVLSIQPEHRFQDFCTWKIAQNLLFCPLSAVQNDHLQLKSSCSIFSQFEAQVFFSNVLFLTPPLPTFAKPIEQHTLKLNKALLNTHATAIFQARND